MPAARWATLRHVERSRNPFLYSLCLLLSLVSTWLCSSTPPRFRSPSFPSHLVMASIVLWVHGRFMILCRVWWCLAVVLRGRGCGSAWVFSSVSLCPGRYIQVFVEPVVAKKLIPRIKGSSMAAMTSGATWIVFRARVTSDMISLVTSTRNLSNRFICARIVMSLALEKWTMYTSAKRIFICATAPSPGPIPQ